MIIYNVNTFYKGQSTKLFAKSITENRLNDQKMMGDFLGYECPTDHNESHLEALEIFMNEYQVHAEVCVDSFPKKVFDKIDQFARILKKYNLDITYKITQHKSDELLLNILERPVENLDFIIKNKNDIINFLFNLNIKDDYKAYNAICTISTFIMKKPNWKDLEREFGEKLVNMLEIVKEAAQLASEYVSFNITSLGFDSIISEMELEIKLDDEESESSESSD